jgi:hypothetical protein
MEDGYVLLVVCVVVVKNYSAISTCGDGDTGGVF